MRQLAKIPLLIRFLAFYLREVVVANLLVAYAALTPTHRMRPAMLAIPLDARTDLEILLLVNLITMNPGTVSIDVSTDRRVLYVHVLFGDDPDAVRADIKGNLERRVLELMR